MLRALCKCYDRWQHRRRIKRECTELTRVGIRHGLVKDVRLLIAKEYVWRKFDENRMPVKYVAGIVVMSCLIGYIAGYIVQFIICNRRQLLCVALDVVMRIFVLYDQLGWFIDSLLFGVENLPVFPSSQTMDCAVVMEKLDEIVATFIKLLKCFF